MKTRIFVAGISLCLLALACSDSSILEAEYQAPSEADAFSKKGGKPGKPPPGDGGGSLSNPAWIMSVNKDDIIQLSFDGASSSSLIKPRKVYHPVYSPDGSRIAYFKYARRSPWEIHVMSSDGTGDYIAFSTATMWVDQIGLAWATNNVVLFNGNRDLHALHVDTGEFYPILRFAYSNMTFDVGPETLGGRYLVYSDSDGSRTTFVDLFAAKIVINIDTDHLEVVDEAPAHLELLDEYDNGQRFPAFSPDGLRIAFIEANAMYWGEELRVIGFDPKKGQFTLPPVTISTSSVHGYPTWSPDGTQIAFAGDACPESGGGTYIYTDLYLVSASGGKPVPVVCHASNSVISGDPFFPDWNPKWDPKLD